MKNADSLLCLCGSYGLHAFTATSGIIILTSHSCATCKWKASNQSLNVLLFAHTILTHHRCSFGVCLNSTIHIFMRSDEFDNATIRLSCFQYFRRLKKAHVPFLPQNTDTPLSVSTHAVRKELYQSHERVPVHFGPLFCQLYTSCPGRTQHWHASSQDDNFREHRSVWVCDCVNTHDGTLRHQMPSKTRRWQLRAGDM